MKPLNTLWRAETAQLSEVATICLSARPLSDTSLVRWKLNFTKIIVICGAVGAFARPALAQQTLNLSLGHFTGSSDRSEADILLIEHHDLAFEFPDFNAVSIGGELLFPIGEKFEAGAGLSLSQRTVSTAHVRTFNADGSSIPRILALRQVPIAATFRFLPLRQAYRVQPYAGGGLAVIGWHFTESGDFVIGGNVFRGEHYETSGTTVGPVFLLGLRVVGDRLAIGMEGRHQHARGSFGPGFARVHDPDIDLNGWTISGTVGLRLRVP